MSKRFTATGKWNDSWFCSLATMDKLFWFYILDNCDSAGMWDVNLPLVRFHLGEYHPEPIRFGGKIVVVAESKWFVPAFVSFQYGELRPDCRPHARVLDALKKHGLKGYLKGINTLEDKNKNKRRQEKGVAGETKSFVPPSLEDVKNYCCERNNKVDPSRFWNFYEAKGWMVGRNKMKDWRAAMRGQWESEAGFNAPEVKAAIAEWSCKFCGSKTNPRSTAWEGDICVKCEKKEASV